MSINDPTGLEEERRLCYVSITRAMQKLFITYAESRRLHGQETMNVSSRFIKELPTENLREIRLQSITRPAFTAPVRSNAVVNGDIAFQLGQLVTHPKFGEGTVLQFEGQGKVPMFKSTLLTMELWLVLLCKA